MNLAYTSLDSLIYVDVHSQFVRRSFVVVVHLGTNLHPLEAVGAIQLFQCGYIVSQERVAESPMAQEPARRLNLEVGSQLRGIQKLLVPADADQSQFMHRPGVDLINYSQSVRAVLLLDIDLRVKVSASLQVIKQVAPPLIQQVVIDGIFLVNRNLLFQSSAADMVSPRRDQNYGTRVDFVCEVHSIRFLAMNLLRNQHLCQRTILFLKALPQPLQRITHPG